MGFPSYGINYLGTALRLALGAGGVLGGAYLVSRINERQNLETRLDRLEQMVEKLATPEKKKQKDA
jgi:hypothetical protein